MRSASCSSDPKFSGSCSYDASKESKRVACTVELPVLNALLNFANHKDLSLSRTIVVYIHHALKTSVNLVEAILALGVEPGNFFVLGKSYSECKEVAENIKKSGVHYQPCSRQNNIGWFYQTFIRDVNCLWEKILSSASCSDIDNLLLLDHGGRALAFIPNEILSRYRVISIEKTSGGFIHFQKSGFPDIPIINVANCAAKKFLEPPLIAKSIIESSPLNQSINHRKSVCGVIGYGAIGKAITEQLVSLNFNIIVYDTELSELKNMNNVNYANFITTVISEADYIFGCTGTDSLAAKEIIEMLEFTSSDKLFLSCSSEDKEFLSLLLAIKNNINDIKSKSPLSDITYENKKGAKITFVKGGFPVNFNTFNETIPAKDIQLTRSLVLLSVLQAAKFFNDSKLNFDRHEILKLDPEGQKFIVQQWLKYQPLDKFSQGMIENFNDISWIAKNSEGKLNRCSIFNKD